ncbi:MAG: transcription elongation factor GreA [Patescibacteria group bacterium]
MSREEYLTKEKFEELKSELEYLKHTRRKEIADELEHAKSLGDLAENAEYHEARNNQRELEERIFKLENILKSAIIIETKHSDTIAPGSIVWVLKNGEETKKKFQIVGSEEVDMALGKISVNSPIGRAIFGKKKGDRFVVELPTGIKINYKVVEIE